MFDRPTLSTTPHPTRPTEAAASIVGIWRLGDPISHGDGTDLFLAQPADAHGNPRFDYVLKAVSVDRSSPQAARRIYQTIQSAATTHPNLIAILDASNSDQRPYVVMPRLDAVPMDVRVDTIEQFAIPVALWWARQTAQALAALHSANWIHGDIHPGNLVVDEKGHVTIIDLGYASRIHSPMSPIFRGTAHYAAPELVAGTTAALPAMDIHALGKVLWECLAAAMPASQTTMESIADLIETMVAADPSDRPTANQIVQRLLQLEIDTLGGHFRPNATRRAA